MCLLCASAIEKLWLNFMKLCIENCEKKLDETQVRICPEGSPFSSNITNNVIPSVILWNPLSHTNNFGQLTCPNCYSALRHWKDGRNDRGNPRNLFCIQERLLLVSVCYMIHKSLNKVRRQIQIPFVLFHKSGVAKHLFDYLGITILTRITIEDVEIVLINLHSSRQST
jgi:hypothetical protein